MWNLYSERARAVVRYAQDEARQSGSDFVLTEHVLLGVIREQDNVASIVLLRMGVDIDSLKTAIRAGIIRREPKSQKSDLQFAADGRRILDSALAESKKLSNNYIGTEHLLLGVVVVAGGLVASVLRESGIDYSAVVATVKEFQSPGSTVAVWPPPPTDGGYT